MIEALLIAALIFGIGVFWIYQFVQLMLLPEVDFPGRHDKYLWAAAFILVLPLAPFAFFGWKFAYKAMLAAETGRAP